MKTTPGVFWGNSLHGFGRICGSEMPLFCNVIRVNLKYTYSNLEKRNNRSCSIAIPNPYCKLSNVLVRTRRWLATKH